MNITTQSHERINYRPENPPKNSTLYKSSESLVNKANMTRDFFQASDNMDANGIKDLDPRKGFVRLENAPAKGLLERGSTSISGFMTPDSKLTANSDTSFGSNVRSSLTMQKDTYSMDRPVYVNDRYAPTTETVKFEQDGSRSFSLTYRPWEQ